MKKVCMLLVICLAFPMSVFAAGTKSTDVVIESGIEAMMLQDASGGV